MGFDYSVSPIEKAALLAGYEAVFVARVVVTHELITDAAFDVLAYSKRKLRQDVAEAIAAVLEICPRVIVEAEDVQTQEIILDLEKPSGRRDVALSLRCTITPAKKE